MVGATYMVLKACRGCLTTTGKLEKVTDMTRRVFFTVCGLQVLPNDGLPQYLCMECSAFLRKTLTFRRKTRRAHFALNEIKKEFQAKNKEITTKDIQRVNRVATNLVSSHDLWIPQTAALYSINVEPQEEELDPETAARVEKAKQESLEFLKFNQDDEEKKDMILKHSGLTKETPLVANKCSILVNIKPENYKELDKLERLREEEEALRQIREEDNHFDDGDNAAEDGNDTNNGVDPATIDMNDIFKDLEEKEKEKENEKEDSDDGWSDDYEKPQTRKQQYRELIKVMTVKRSRSVLNKQDTRLALFMVENHMFRDCLGMAEFRYMSHEEQLETFKKRAKRLEYIKSRFRCSMCLISVADRQSLINHSIEMHKHHKARCDICKAGFESNTHLEVHKAWQHWYEYTCVCGDMYYTFADLAKCVQRHLIVDDLCTKEQLIQRHKEQEERVEKYFHKTLIAPEEWYLSTTTSVFKTSRICDQCGESFRSLKVLLQHRQEEVFKGCIQITECGVCQHQFKTKEALSNHFEKSHTYMYKCKRCTFSSYRNDALTHSCKEFKRYKAGPIMPSSHHCVECAQYFTARASLFAHQLDHHCLIKISAPELTPSEFTCVPCNLRFSNQYALYNHKMYANHITKLYKLKEVVPENTKISREFPTTCSQCDAVITNQRHLTYHMNRKHPEAATATGEMGMCHLCGVLLTRQALYMHKDNCTQLVERKRCKFCPNHYGKSWELIIHTLRHHIVKPFACGQCLMRFTLKDRCKTHILKLHAPVKLYSCEICGIQFSCSEYCRNHMRKVHKVRIPRRKETVQRISASRTSLICYPDMRFVVTADMPMSIIEDSDLLLSDYLDKTATPVPKDQIKDYFIFNMETEVVPCKQDTKKKSAATKKELPATKEEPPAATKEQPQENVENDEYVISYVRNQDGGFIKKEEVEDNVEDFLAKSKDIAVKQDGGQNKTEKKKQNKKVKKAKKEHQLEIKKIDHEWEDSTGQGFDMPMLIDENAEELGNKEFFTQKSEISEENPPETYIQVEEGVEDQTDLAECELGTEGNPLRMEIDADELIQKYGIVMLDGVQYANIDGTLYKVEYS